MSRRRLIQAAALLAIGVLILYGLLRTVHPDQVLTAIRGANPGWIAIGLTGYADFIVIRSWRDRETVALQIADEGDGIPQGDLEHIFDKFYRAQKTDQVRAGTGLGLAISRGFVEAMHGTIVATNRADRRGAVFTITLPIPDERQRLDAAA